MHCTTDLECPDCPFFDQCHTRHLPDGALAELENSKRTLTFRKGETIFHQDDPSAFFYGMRSGRVQIFRSGPAREVSFSVTEPGEWLGYRDALTGSPYRHNARALSNTIVCRFESSILTHWLETHPVFAAAMARNMAAAWTESENQSYNLGARKIVERLAYFLLSLEAGGTNRPIHPDDDLSDLRIPEPELPTDREVELPLTRELVGTIIGSTTESVIRGLSDFKARGWIRMEKGKVRLTNRAELSRLVLES